MAYEFLEEEKAKKKKKMGAYSFLEGVEEFESDEISKVLPQKEKESSDELDHTSTLALKEEKTEERGDTTTEEQKDAVKLDLFASAKAKKKEAPVMEIDKVGGLLGKVLSGELKPPSEKPTEVLAGLAGLEKAAKLGKKISGEVVEEGKGYKIISRKGEKTLTYLVSMPEFSVEDKKQLRAIEKKAIAEIDVDPEVMHNYAQKKKVFTEKVIEM
ncbi:MAG: hypothetical protein ACE5HH_01375, partial [Candidatus Hydrothermarchaeales archaeon]